MDLRDCVRQFLQNHGIRLNTDLGQHFLADQTVLEKILEAAEITPTDHIVEIGPGIGILTAELVPRAKHVTAIELDKRLIPLLQKFIDAPANLTIIQGNALHTSMPAEPYKVVANIPYHITSPLLRHIFLESPCRPSSLTLLLQREVAEKIADMQDAGLLTILVALFGTARLVTRVPPSSFLPPPEVDSTVLQIECFEKPLADAGTIEEIFKLTKVAFSGKRKMLRNTFGNLPDGMERLERVGIDPTRRPQTLSIEEWIRLAR